MTSSENKSEDDQEYGLIQSFFIDTDAYTDRDREMFVCGAEFEQIREEMNLGILRTIGRKPIHRENESRIRMMLAKKNITFRITPHVGYEGCETWSELEILDSPKTNPF